MAELTREELEKIISGTTSFDSFKLTILGKCYDSDNPVYLVYYPDYYGHPIFNDAFFFCDPSKFIHLTIVRAREIFNSSSTLYWLAEQALMSLYYRYRFGFDGSHDWVNYRNRKK